MRKNFYQKTKKLLTIFDIYIIMQELVSEPNKSVTYQIADGM